MTLAQLSFERIRFLWDKLKEFEVLFNDHFQHDFKKFADAFVLQIDGEPVPTGLIWDIDDVGIVYLTDMVAEANALIHFLFWDRRWRGREELCRTMIRYIFDRYRFHKLTWQVPLYAFHTMAAVERIGFTLDGRIRDDVRYKGQWFDVNYYSVLEGELDGTTY